MKDTRLEKKINTVKHDYKTDENYINNIKFTNDVIMEKRGKRLYKDNDFYKSLSNLMTNPDFKIILEKFWNNEMEIKSFIMYIQLYQY